MLSFSAFSVLLLLLSSLQDTKRLFPEATIAHTLNAIISMLGMTSKRPLMFVMSKSKFSLDRRCSTASSLDDNSTPGSQRCLLRLSSASAHPSVASLGAIPILSAFGLNLFVQQFVRYESVTHRWHFRNAYTSLPFTRYVHVAREGCLKMYWQCS